MLRPGSGPPLMTYTPTDMMAIAIQSTGEGHSPRMGMPISAVMAGHEAAKAAAGRAENADCQTVDDIGDDGGQETLDKRLQGYGARRCLEDAGSRDDCIGRNVDQHRSDRRDSGGVKRIEACPPHRHRIAGKSQR